ncbi:cytochrome P450 [Streptomyces sp. AN091965]|uniref:cytochrome P450 n=1 Tax=Streptomyces sp. AN091965 TaxID=2927803 RepID=UPI001F6088C4|nr:cytochrome P450 [Streptomyces sp. AN091965]MCI3927854.1 cytochrome P450 [Streptomyces sp. AN091965]
MSEQFSRLTNATVSNPAEYGPLREQGPLLRTVIDGAELPVWFVVGFDDCKEILHDSRFIRDQSKLPGAEGPSLTDEILKQVGMPREYFKYFGLLTLSDGEEHTRLRNVVARAFTARRVNALRAGLERTASDLHAALSAKGEGDLISELGYPLATASICELMGIEEADRPQLQDWIMELATYDPERFVPAVRGIVEYFKDLIARRRSEPTDDLVSVLVKPGGMDQDLLVEDVIISISLLLTNTGIAPPAYFLGQAVLSLLSHPDELARLRTRPELLAKHAVPELFRYATSVPTGGPLYAAEDFEFRGCPVKRGDPVVPSLVGVNHDPKQFSDPQRLDVARDLGPGIGHLAFGSGSHYCTGAGLAELETEIVIDTFLIQNQGMELAVEPDQLQYFDLPGKGTLLSSLPVRF